MKELFYNANIITPYQEYTQMVIEDGEIIYLGNKLNEKDNENLISYDMNKCTILPGFLDCFGHFLEYALLLNTCKLHNCRSVNEILNCLIKYDKEHQGDFIIAYGYDNELISDISELNKDLLDRYFLYKGVLIIHISGNKGYANSQMLKRFYTLKELKNDDGYLENKDFFEAINYLPKPNNEKLFKLLRQAEKNYLKNGIVVAHNTFYKKDDLKTLYDYAQSDSKIRIVGHVENIDNFHEIKSKQEKFNLLGAEITLDSPCNIFACGKSEEELQRVIKDCLSKKIQLICHVNNEDSLQQFLKNSIINENRNVCFCHDIGDMENIKAFKNLKIIPSYSASHLYYYADSSLKKNTAALLPVSTTIKEGLLCTINSEMPALEPSILKILDTIIRRKTFNNIQISKEEKVDIKEALKLVTSNMAYQYGLESEFGSLEVSKEATFIVLSNKLTCDNLIDTKIERVYIKGKNIILG